ncbi:MAG: GntR family transcriptional regulator [Anaerolineaceae bacterium]|nr:GntR family transcriptional regulator [Anaerolineaceae bacterium]
MVFNTSSRLNQVKTYLINYIDEKQLTGNDQLPSEASIAKTLGVSRNTLREAYVALENEGIIIRRHGIGTFVAHSAFIRDSLNDFSPFANIIRDSGYTPGFQTLSMDYEYAPNNVYNVFAAPSSIKLRCLKRVVQADQQPVIYIEDYIAPAVDAVILNWDAFDGNLVHFLSASLDTPLNRIQSRIRASAIKPEFSKYLELPEGTPILSVRSIIFAVDNQPITYSNICFNSNIVEMNIVRTIRTI